MNFLEFSTFSTIEIFHSVLTIGKTDTKFILVVPIQFAESICRFIFNEPRPVVAERIMEPSIRRKDRKITREDAVAVLDAAEYGFLSLVDPDGNPYGIPVNFVRRDDRLIVHCALEGRKLDCIRHENRVSFCVVGRTRVLPHQFTTEYESAVVEGIAEIVEDDDRKIEDLKILCQKYAPKNYPLEDGPYENAPAEFDRATEKAIQRSLARTGIIEIRMDSIAGKAKRPVNKPVGK